MRINTIQTEQFLSVPDAAALLGVSVRTLGRLLDQGVIPFTKPRGHRRVKRADVIAYRQQQTVGPECSRELPAVLNHLAD